MPYQPDMSPAAIKAELCAATKAAAVAAAPWSLYGPGHENAADAAAVEAMDKALTAGSLSVVVAGCEGKKDGADQLDDNRRYNTHDGTPDGEVRFGLVADPIERTSNLVRNRPGAMATAGLALPELLPRWADPFVFYTNKLVVPRRAASLITEGLVRVDGDPTENLQLIAEALGICARELRVAILDRPRNSGVIEAAQKVGARAVLLSGGDVLPVMRAAVREDDGDLILYGSGGTPEAVLAAIIAQATGAAGHFRLHPQTPEEVAAVRARPSEETELRSDRLEGPVYFAATAITPNILLRGAMRDPATGAWEPGGSLVVGKPAKQPAAAPASVVAA